MRRAGRDDEAVARSDLEGPSVDLEAEAAALDVGRLDVDVVVEAAFRPRLEGEGDDWVITYAWRQDHAPG